MSNKVINIPIETSDQIDDIKSRLETKLGTTLSQRQVVEMMVKFYQTEMYHDRDMEVLKNAAG
tara:strand:+ start:259 stop:447 length:189 start_codon:yes stop_codon:yes gene_type:complete